jgi:hypothetical protein
LTQVCIKTGHLEAASICFKHLGNPLALCTSDEDEVMEIDAPVTREDQLGDMAVQLGMVMSGSEP